MPVSGDGVIILEETTRPYLFMLPLALCENREEFLEFTKQNSFGSQFWQGRVSVLKRGFPKALLCPQRYNFSHRGWLESEHSVV